MRTLAEEPVFYDEDPLVEAVHAGLGAEHERVAAAGDVIRRGAIPALADDTYGLLGLWESTFGLPVEPANTPIEARQSNVAARDGRDVSTGSATTEALNAFIGTGWTYQRDFAGPWTGLLTIPFSSGGYTAAQTLALIDELLPANLIVTVAYQGRFVLGRSRLGVGVF